jgi:cytochrome P450
MAEYSGNETVDEVFEDGIVDVYQRLGALHGGQRAVRVAESVTFTRMEDIVAVTKRRDVHSMDPDTLELVSSAMGAGRPLIPLMLDGAEHTKYRKLLDPLFAPKRIAELEPTIRGLAESLIDGFAADGEVDLYNAYCDALPSQIFLSLLGLPLDDIEFLLWFKDGVIRPTDEEHRAAASPKMIEYLYAELDRREAAGEPGDDLIGGFMTAEVDGHTLTREDVIDITFLLVLAGLDTVAASLSCMIEWLARHPTERQQLVDDPSLLTAAIEELMRVQTPVVAGGRHATADFEISGVQVKAGDHLRMMWSAADLDPEVFDDPLTVDFTRQNNRHIAFASGFHRCLGSHLARTELRVAMEVLHERLPDYGLDPRQTPGYKNVAIRCVDPLPLVFTPEGVSG